MLIGLWIFSEKYLFESHPFCVLLSQRSPFLWFVGYILDTNLWSLNKEFGICWVMFVSSPLLDSSFHCLHAVLIVKILHFSGKSAILLS